MLEFMVHRQEAPGLLAADEDVVVDLIGYLVLLKIALSRKILTHDL